jgi:hypothetical protein
VADLKQRPWQISPGMSTDSKRQLQQELADLKKQFSNIQFQVSNGIGNKAELTRSLEGIAEEIKSRHLTDIQYHIQQGTAEKVEKDLVSLMNKASASAEKAAPKTLFSNISGAIDDIKDKIGSFLVAGGLIEGIKSIADYFGKAVDAAVQEAKANANLEVSFQRVGITSKEVLKQAIEVADELSNSLFTPEQIKNAEAFAVSIGLPANQLTELTKVAMDFSQGAGISLEQAFKLMQKGSGDNADVLKKMGIEIGKSGDLIQTLKERFGGTVDKVTGVTSGMEAFKKAQDETSKAIGSSFLPIVDKFQGFLAGLIKSFLLAPNIIKAVVLPITTVATAFGALSLVLKTLSTTVLPQLAASLGTVTAAAGGIGILIAGVTTLAAVVDSVKTEKFTKLGYDLEKGTVIDADRAQKMVDNIKKYNDLVKKLPKPQADINGNVNMMGYENDKQALQNKLNMGMGPADLEMVSANLDKIQKLIDKRRELDNQLKKPAGIPNDIKKTLSEIDMEKIDYEIKIHVDPQQLLTDIRSAMAEVGAEASSTLGTDKLVGALKGIQDYHATIQDLVDYKTQIAAAGITIDETDKKEVENLVVMKGHYDDILKQTKTVADNSKEIAENQKDAEDAQSQAYSVISGAAADMKSMSDYINDMTAAWRSQSTAVAELNHQLQDYSDKINTMKSYIDYINAISGPTSALLSANKTTLGYKQGLISTLASSLGLTVNATTGAYDVNQVLNLGTDLGTQASKVSSVTAAVNVIGGESKETTANQYQGDYIVTTTDYNNLVPLLSYLVSKGLISQSDVNAINFIPRTVKGSLLGSWYDLTPGDYGRLQGLMSAASNALSQKKTNLGTFQQTAIDIADLSSTIAGEQVLINDGGGDTRNAAAQQAYTDYQASLSHQRSTDSSNYLKAESAGATADQLQAIKLQGQNAELKLMQDFAKSSYFVALKLSDQDSILEGIAQLQDDIKATTTGNTAATVANTNALNLLQSSLQSLASSGVLDVENYAQQAKLLGLANNAGLSAADQMELWNKLGVTGLQNIPGDSVPNVKLDVNVTSDNTEQAVTTKLISLFAGGGN